MSVDVRKPGKKEEREGGATQGTYLKNVMHPNVALSMVLTIKLLCSKFISA